VRHPIEKTYTLGPALIELAAGVAPDEFHALEYARGEMTTLAEELGLVCVATELVGDETAVLAVRVPTSLQPGAPGATIPNVGRRLPWARPIGPIFAVWSTPEDQQGWLARAESTVGSDGDNQYRKHLEAIRKRGFDVGLTADTRRRVLKALADIGEDTSPRELRRLLAGLREDSDTDEDPLLELGPATRLHNVHNIMAPVFGGEGMVVIGLNVNGFADQLRTRGINEYGRRLMESTLRVTEAIHGSVPNDYPLPAPGARKTRRAKSSL
jgi:DNA-binding IclR family transcriptional regulator